MEKTMSFVADNKAYEAWLKTQCTVVRKDLAYKHERMRLDAFTFLRATFFRWAGTIESLCPALKHAPALPAVGDVHLENFGTWRDGEGRLIWGINDFDEAAVMPYAFDLLRLATSVRLAPGMPIGNREAAAAIIAGYRRGLARPRPTLLDEQETWMRPLVACSDADRRQFWEEIHALAPAKPPEAVVKLLKQSLPQGAAKLRFFARRKGAGGLGRARFAVSAEWQGGHILREARALVPSAWDWAHGTTDRRPRSLELATGRHRAPDPTLQVRQKFILRRLSPDSRKVELGDGAGPKVTAALLEAMGFDLGAIHAADKSRAVRILRDLDSRPADWLRESTKAAVVAVTKDFEAWKAARP